MNKKMKIEVWTDIMCPYCYIGKINYEKALRRFEHADEVELKIKAFQLNPNLPDKGKGFPVIDYLLKTAEFPENRMQQMFANIEKLAADADVPFNLPNAIVANTRDAHRLIKFAAKRNLESEVLHKISKAYFEDAQDYSDIDLLVKIGVEAGLDETEIREMFESDAYQKEVADDIAEARQLGIDTVPTFLFNRKRAIIGAEPVDAFLKNLELSYSDWVSEKENDADIQVSKGKSCNADGTCEL